MKVIVDINPPEGATHFVGSVIDEPCWLKCKQIAGFDHWFFYDAELETWFLLSHAAPHFIRSLQEIAFQPQV